MATDLDVLQEIFANEFTQTYQQRMSVLRGTVQTKGSVQGEKFHFITSGAVDTAVKRAANGDIPVASRKRSKVTATLEAYYHHMRVPGFNIAATSVPERIQMSKDGVMSINQATDQMIIAEMEKTTYNTGAAAAASLSWALAACELLWENEVPPDGECYAIVTPKAWAQLMKIKEFASRDYVDDKPFMKKVEMRNWMGVKWMVHTRLPGRGTNAAKCFLYHKDAVGHALATPNTGGNGYAIEIGVDREQDRSWALAKSYQGAALIQAEGVIQINHDDTAAL